MDNSRDAFLDYFSRQEQILESYRIGEGLLISDETRAALDFGDSWLEEHGQGETKYGIDAVSIDDARVRLRVNAERFDNMAIRPDVLGNGLEGVKASRFVAQAFERFFWIASYCEKHGIALEKRQVAGIFRAADDIVNILMMDDEHYQMRMAKMADFCERFEGRRPSKADLHMMIFELVEHWAMNLHEAIDLLLADCVMRETVKATLKSLEGRPDKERILERLHDEDIAELFEDVRKRCDITSAVERNTETVKDATRAVDSNTDAVKELTEQRQEAAHFPNTGVPLSLTDAADLFWRVFCDEIRTLPQCKDDKCNLNVFFHRNVYGEDISSLRKAFNDWAKCKGFDTQKVSARGNGRDIDAYDVAEYYEMMATQNIIPPQLRRHFENQGIFEAITARILELHKKAKR